MDERLEWLHCREDVAYFVERHVCIYDATAQDWLPFHLWPAQREVLGRMAEDRMLVILKARQLGLSWLTLAYCLWVMCFFAPATILLFSLRRDDAEELLVRLRGMYAKLPRWMRARRSLRDGSGVWELSSGSRAIAFSTKAGRGYTGTVAVVDEADYVPDLGLFLNGVKPTIDAGGKLFLISTSDKRTPVSTFKQLYRAAVAGVGDYKAVFLPWSARPGRDQAWHDRTKAEMFAQRGTDDDFLAEYPATPEEALAAEQLDRRLPSGWVLPCVESREPVRMPGIPAIPGLTVYEPPRSGASYVVGVDPAEGNVHSDESVACIMAVDTWAQVAVVAGRFDPALMIRAVEAVSRFYNGADVLVERNNHGHSLLHGLTEGGVVRVLAGYDGRPGWLSNVKGKPLLYDAVAKALQDGVVRIRDGETAVQLASIEASTLRAPDGLHDDRADAFGLCVAALAYGYATLEGSVVVEAVDVLDDVDKDGF